MKSIDKEIEVVSDNEFSKFTFDLHVCGFHIYQTVVSNHWWKRFRIQTQKTKRRRWICNWRLPLWFAESNHGRTYSTEEIQIVYKFLWLPNSKVYCRVSGNRNTGYCSEIPITYTLKGMEKLLNGYPKSTKIWKLMEIWKIDVWNKITWKVKYL